MRVRIDQTAFVALAVARRRPSPTGRAFRLGIEPEFQTARDQFGLLMRVQVAGFQIDRAVGAIQ